MNTYRKLSLLLIRVGLFIVPFVPLYISNSLFFPFITGKAFLFRTAVEIAFVLWLGLALFFPEFRPRKTPLLYALGIFLFVVALATVFGANPERSFWSNFERMEGLISHLHLFAYFLIIAHTFRREDWNLFFGFFVASGLIQNFYALSQKLGYIGSPQGGFRTDGTIGNPTYLSAYLIFVLAISVMMFFRGRIERFRHVIGWGFGAFIVLFSLLTSSAGVSVGKALNANPVFWVELFVFLAFFGATFFLRDDVKLGKIFAGTVAIFTLATIFFSATRGVILALFVGFLIAGILYLIFEKPKSKAAIRTRRIVAGTLVFLFVLGIGLRMARNTELVKGNDILSRIASISLSEGKTRFTIWNMGFQGFKERPVLGWGPENYNLVFAKHYDPRLYTQEPWFDRSHNIIFDWLINAGIIGLFAYLGIFAAAGLLLIKSWKAATPGGDPWAKPDFRDTVVIVILLFVYLAQNFFVFDQIATYISFFSILAYLHFRAVSGAERQVKQESGSAEFWKGIVVAGGTIAMLFVFYASIWKPLQANRNLLRALQIQGTTQNLAAAGAAFEKALAYDTFGNPEVREHMSQFVISAIGSDIAPDLKEQFFNRIVKEYEIGIEKAPLDPRVRLFLGTVYSRAGLTADALDIFEEALALSPKKQQIYFEIADLYIQQRNYPKAVELLEKVFAFAPDFSEARIALAAGYILNGEQAKADALLVEAFESPHVLRPVLIQVYTVMKKYDRLLAIWERYSKIDPTNLEYRKKLSATYLELNRPREAIRALEEAIKDIPSFKTEGEEFIAAIRQEFRL